MESVSTVVAAPVQARPAAHRTALGLAAVVGLYMAVVYLMPAPAGVSPAGWRVTGVFFATIAGLMLRPLPGAVVVLIGIFALALVGGLTMGQALVGFASSSVWLVLLAMLMSRALRDSGLARRIALVFVRVFGRTSLGVSYSLLATDVVLASSIPSITARNGGIVLPVARNIAELYDSTPGPSAARLGTFLMAALYQGSVIACSMFVTGQASNLLAAGFAAKLAGVEVTWSSWFVAGLVPGLASCLVVPFLVYRLLPPSLSSTPAAVDYARLELATMGPLTQDEKIVLVIATGVCALWMTSDCTVST